MAFGFFKKNKEKKEALHYDPANITVMDIRKGWVFEYDLKTWEVTEEYEYDWGNNHFTYEFKCVSSDDVIYLAPEEDDALICYVMRKISFGKLDEAVERSIIDKQTAPRKVELDGITFFKESERPGYYRSIDDEDWSEFVVWDYLDDSGKSALSIEQWGDTLFESAVGLIENARAFSNILPV